MGQPWRHHYVPQMVLRGFADAEDSLFYFDKTRPQDGIRREPPKPIFFERDLYSSVDSATGAMDAGFETYLGQNVEDRAARVIRKIVGAARDRKVPALSPRERAVWLNFWYYQFKRVPDMAEPLVGDLEAKLLNGIVEDSGGDRELRADERALLEDPIVRARVVRNARVGAQSSPPPLMVREAMASRGMLVAVIGDPRKAFVIGSNPMVTLPTLGGLINNREPGIEVWLPVASDVAVSPGGPPGQEHLFVVDDHSAIRRVNENIVAQSRQFAGRSRELIASLARRR